MIEWQPLYPTLVDIEPMAQNDFCKVQFEQKALPN